MTTPISGWTFLSLIEAKIEVYRLRADCLHERTQLVPWLNNDGWWELCLDCGRKEEL